ncbi:hypothetical protein [Paenibacillus qinlingensis]|uniref:Uncharacterized protein n=1 Tax=Paenibacillus qinlingensis TaxID=1837343 RepID=A0ABU1NQH8_9BACL|nr:hypothetical protein [Paenibacillus qinlingensis]MDR6549731.1 hypothetical protein [Paenibacillus qinlingensis]
MLRKLLSLIVMMVIGLTIMTGFHSSTAYACSCAQPQTVEEQLSHSEAVFAGRVLEVKVQSNAKSGSTKAAVFEVSRIWKGGTESQITVHTGSGGGDCGFNFEKGKEYLVYAHPSTMYGDKELLVTIICDRTKGLDQAREDLAALGVGKIPSEQVRMEGDPGQIDPTIWIALTGVVVIGITGATILIVRRKMR